MRFFPRTKSRIRQGPSVLVIIRQVVKVVISTIVKMRQVLSALGCHRSMKLSILFRHLKETKTTQVAFVLAIVGFHFFLFFSEDILALIFKFQDLLFLLYALVLLYVLFQQCETKIRHRLRYRPKVQVSEPKFYLPKPKLFFVKFYSFFPTSWGKTSFYKLENKPNPSKKFKSIQCLEKNLVLGALL